MSFKQIFSAFVSGEKIKRKAWKGYWRYYFSKIEMHSKDGTVTNFCDTNDILFTISHITENDWEFATVENCPVLAEEQIV